MIIFHHLALLLPRKQVDNPARISWHTPVIFAPPPEPASPIKYPYITRSCFFTDLEGFLPSRSVGMPRDPLYHLERRKGKLRLSRAKIKLNQRLSRKPKPYHLLRLSRGCHQTIPTSLEGVNHTIFTSLEGQNHTKFTSLEELNHTILKSLNSAKKLDHSITYVSRGQNHTFKTII